MEPVNQITLRKWRRGFFIAALSGLAAAGVSWGIDLTLKQGILLTVGFISREVGRYINSHPADIISDSDTSPHKFVKTVATVETKISDQSTMEEKKYEGK